MEARGARRWGNWEKRAATAVRQFLRRVFLGTNGDAWADRAAAGSCHKELSSMLVEGALGPGGARDADNGERRLLLGCWGEAGGGGGGECCIASVMGERAPGGLRNEGCWL